MTTHKKVIDSSKVLQAPSVDECLALVKQAQTAFGANPITLSKVGKRRAPKPRSTSPEVITTLGRLVTEHGLALPKHSVATMLTNLQTVQTLAPLKAAVQALQKIVDDGMVSANGDAWSSATSYYTALSRVKDKDPTLEAALAPLMTVFKKGHKPKAKKPSSSTTASKKKVTPASTTASATEAVSSGAAPAGEAVASTTHA